MKIVFLDAVTLGEDISLHEINTMLERNGEVFIYELSSSETIGSRIADADVIITNKCRLSGEILSHGKNLKLICVCATGYDNIDVEYCRSSGIALCNLIGYSTDSVAQVTMSMVLALVNRLSSYNRYVHDGTYAASGCPNQLFPVYHEIAGMTWGIVGCGSIGRRVAGLAETFGARVIVYTRSNSSGYEKAGIDELCRTSDIITLHTPLNDGTYHLINKDRIAMMKKNAVLINVARGAVLDETAAAEAIINGKIGGIGIDVYDGEPVSRRSPYTKLYGMNNVILTPHMAWGSYESRIRCIKMVSENIEAFFNGEQKSRVV